MFEPVTEELIRRLIYQSPTKSCTFDPIPTTMLRRHESTFGISGVALCWFESYLSDRTQSVVVDGA